MTPHYAKKAKSMKLTPSAAHTATPVWFLTFNERAHEPSVSNATTSAGTTSAMDATTFEPNPATSTDHLPK